MLKQGAVQEALTDLTLPASSLPPLNNLPQWSRVNTLDKARYPKPFLKDRLQPLPNPGTESSSPIVDENGEIDRELEFGNTSNPKQRVHHLEKSVNFLRQQHHEVLSHLHEEIDKLKRDNKELQFRVVMIDKTPDSAGAKHRRTSSKVTKARGTSVSSEGTDVLATQQPEDNAGFPERHSQDDKIEELKVIFLEEEIKELKKSYKEERNRNNVLTQMLAQAESRQLGRDRSNMSIHRSNDRSYKSPSAHTSNAPTKTDASSEDTPRSGAEPLPFNATLEPLLVQLGHETRPPTLQECQLIMKHLQQTNDRQSHELNQLKSDLRDVLYSHKWTPDAYLLAKAYIAEDDAKEAAEQDKLPRIPLRQPTRKLPDVAYIQKDALSLPALKQTMGNKAIERRKRTQILHKTRFRREVLNPPEVSEG